MSRTNQILELLATRPFASVRDLQEHLGVSAATIRRDIERMDVEGSARKVYGGIAANDGASKHGLAARPIRENLTVAIEAKTEIARVAASLVQDGERLILFPGSTCFLLGSQLANRNVSIYTNSIPLAGFLGDHGTCTYIIGGGDAHREPGLYHRAGQDPRPFYASRLFMSAQGIGADGLRESNPLIVEVTQVFKNWADEVVVLLDSRKFSLSARFPSLELSRIDLLITDSGLSGRNARWLEDEGVKYIVAGDASGSEE